MAALGAQLDKITAALIADDGPTPIAFVRKAREIEADILQAKQDEAMAEADLVRASRREIPTMAEEWRRLKDGAMRLDYDARMQVRQLVRDTFERIVIYHRGVHPDADGAHIDLVILAIGGGSRMLRIARQTGAWVAQENFS